MQDSIQKVRVDIASLEATYKESRSVYRRLRRAKNRLAYLTASLFVVVDGRDEITVYGVSNELTTRTQHFSMKIGASVQTSEERTVDVSVSPNFSTASVTFYLSTGNQASFEIAQENLDGSLERIRYLVRAFTKSDEAEEWARKKRLERSSH